jgi:hypothetical protein
MTDVRTMTAEKLLHVSAPAYNASVSLLAHAGQSSELISIAVPQITAD